MTAISPIDGRYYRQAGPLSEYFSEYALIRARVLVEVEYFIALCEWPLPELKGVDASLFPKLRGIYTDFSVEDARHVKEIEKTTNHDVKAVEYFLKEKWDALQLSEYKEFIHFGLTSQDINNTATPWLLRSFHQKVWEPAFAELSAVLLERAESWKEVPMLAKTHGQPASPTVLG